jgi:hypothetical protein
MKRRFLDSRVFVFGEKLQRRDTLVRFQIAQGLG